MSSRLAILIFSPLAILLAVGSIVWRSMSAPPVETKPYQSMGVILAEECAKRSFLEVAVLETDAAKGTPVMLEQEAFFKEANALGITIGQRIMIHTDPGLHQKGISVADYASAVEGIQSDVVISFVGHPLVEEEHLAEYNAGAFPTLIAVSRTQKRIHRLINEANSVAFLILPRFTFPSPVADAPGSREEWFLKYFQIVESPEDLPLKSREVQ